LLIRRALKVAVEDKETPLGVAEVQEKRNTLAHRLEAWYEIQAHYMPGIADLRAVNLRSFSRPELHHLYLPSSAQISIWQPGIKSLAEQEAWLCLAQADDALIELRRLLQITAGLWQYKYKQVGPSQRSSTRTRAMIGRFRV
jgi:hypothetical protein